MSRRWVVAVVLGALVAAGAVCAVSASRTGSQPPLDRPTAEPESAAAAEARRARAAAPVSATEAETVAPVAEAPSVPKEKTGGTVRGVVRDRQGTPVAGASVYLVPADAPALLDDPASTFVSSTLGERKAFRADSRADGAYAIEAVPFDAEHIAFAVPRVGLATSERTAGVKVRAEAPVTEIDLVVRAPGALDVVVTTFDGRPIVWGEARLVRSEERRSFPVSSVGRLRVEPLDIGTYELTIRARGLPAIQRAVDIEEGRRTGVEVELPRPNAIEGVVVDDAGRPVGDVRVVATRAPWQSEYKGLPASESDTKTDAQGAFRIDSLHEGPHELQVYDPDRRLEGRLGNVTAPSAGARLVVARQSTLRFRLVPPERAAPPSELYVLIHSGGYRPSWQPGPIEIGKLSPGTETVKFRIPGFVPFERDVELKPGDVTDLGDIPLDLGHTMKGRVVDASGKPIADAELRAGDVFTPTQQNATTGADGAFQFEHLAADVHDVKVAADGYMGRFVELRAGPGEPVQDVTLVRGGLLRGTVRRRDGTTVVEAFAHVFDAAAKARGDDLDDREEWTRTDARGAFEARLLPGRYRVEADFKAGEKELHAEADVDLSEGVTTPLVIDLPE